MKTKTPLIPCREKGCQHAPFSTPQGENLHYHRVHSGRVKRLHQNGHSRVAIPVAVAPVEKVDKRTRAWRDAHPQEVKAIGLRGVPRKKQKHRTSAAPAQHTEAKFCPCCGFNLVVLSLAMSLASKHQHQVV